MIVDINGSCSTLRFLMITIIQHHLLLHLLLPLIYTLDEQQTLLLLSQWFHTALVLDLITHIFYWSSLIIYGCICLVFWILWFLINLPLVFPSYLETLQLCYCFRLTTSCRFALLFMDWQLRFTFDNSWWLYLTLWLFCLLFVKLFSYFLLSELWYEGCDVSCVFWIND